MIKIKLIFASIVTSKIALLRKQNLVLFSCLCITLNGCSLFQNAHSPAPIYKKPKVTNPYAKPAVVTVKPVKRITKIEKTEEKVHSEISNQKKSINSADTYLEVEKPVTTKPLSPAVLALLTQANNSSQQGDLETAVATIERALRIDPRNPALTYKLAALRLKQSKPRLAEDLAKKAALLSANNKSLKRKSWLLIGEARKKQKNFFGAKEAISKANSI